MRITGCNFGNFYNINKKAPAGNPAGALFKKITFTTGAANPEQAERCSLVSVSQGPKEHCSSALASPEQAERWMRMKSRYQPR
jgi:hypothetical protein